MTRDDDLTRDQYLKKYGWREYHAKFGDQPTESALRDYWARRAIETLFQDLNEASRYTEEELAYLKKERDRKRGIQKIIRRSIDLGATEKTCVEVQYEMCKFLGLKPMTDIGSDFYKLPGAPSPLVMPCLRVLGELTAEGKTAKMAILKDLGKATEIFNRMHCSREGVLEVIKLIVAELKLEEHVKILEAVEPVTGHNYRIIEVTEQAAKSALDAYNALNPKTAPVSRRPEKPIEDRNIALPPKIKPPKRLVVEFFRKVFRTRSG
ncbi:hypothetical protein HYT84_04535 [Candidatus Micrarchaeota archaeon]|nr:hypothetical protein [Candidatus Micrarchaeota archaeon]